MRWCLSTPGSPKYILPVTQSISVIPLSLYFHTPPGRRPPAQLSGGVGGEKQIFPPQCRLIHSDSDTQTHTHRLLHVGSIATFHLPLATCQLQSVRRRLRMYSPIHRKSPNWLTTPRLIIRGTYISFCSATSIFNCGLPLTSIDWCRNHVKSKNEGTILGIM